MRFTLIYTGDLKANARPDHKHQLRKAFHLQLKTLWQQVPLVDHAEWYSKTETKHKVNLNRRVGPYRFVPLICQDLHLVCELSINMLRPEPPGCLITQGGDIDNRLKTLFDSLRIPKNEGELPKEHDNVPDDDPFFCLLEDDNLITCINVKTDRLLIKTDSDSQVHLDIIVETKPVKTIYRNENSKSMEISGGFALA